MSKSDLNRWIPVFFLAFAALMVVFRTLLEPTGRVVGHSLGEASSHLWIQWWLDRGLRNGFSLFGQQGIVLHEQVWVMPSDWTTRAVVGPLGWLLGRVAAYNMGVFGLLLWAGVASMLLAQRAGASRWPAMFAGLLVMWHPALLGYAADGRIDSMGVGWAALVGWGWLGIARAPSIKHGLLLGACASGAIFSGINLTVAISLTAAIPTAWLLATRPASRLPMGAAAGVAASALSAMLFTLVSVEGNDPGRLQQQSHPEGRTFFVQADMNDVLLEIWAGAHALHRTVLNEMWSLPDIVSSFSSTERAARDMVLQLYAPGGWWFLSVVGVVLVLGSAVLSPRKVLPWAVAAVCLQFMALGLGPSQSMPLSLGGTHSYHISPGVFLESLPGLSSFNNYGLFGVLAALAQGIAVSIGLTHLRRPMPWVCLAVLSWGMEIVVRSPVPFPLSSTVVAPPASWIQEIEKTEQTEGVLVLPVSEHTWLLQTHHGRPGILRFRPKDVEGNRIPLYADETGRISDFVHTITNRQRRSHCDLSGTGLGMVVLIPQLLPPSQKQPIIDRLDACLGSPDAIHESARFYHLP